MDSIKMTAGELAKLREELVELETAGRGEIAARIKTAREWGDLKENGEYHAAKEAQAHLETKILKLRGQLRSAEVVEQVDSSAVQHSSQVEVTDLRNDKQLTYRIVSPNDADAKQGLISAASPVGQALLGKAVGEVAEISTPAGVRPLRIDAIS